MDKNKSYYRLVMKSVSKYLYHYLQTYLQPNRSNFNFTPLSRTFLSSILYKINIANLKWKTENIHYETKWENKHFSDYEYIPSEIRKNWIDKIPKNTIIQRKCTLHIGDKIFHIYVWFPTINRTVNPAIIMSESEIENKIQRTIHKIYLWLSVATSYITKPTKCSKEVNIFLYLTHHSKFLPNSPRKRIDQICVNTAFTTGCVTVETNIHIFREEEWFKVLIHETFHNLGLDFIAMDNRDVNLKILKLFPISVTDIRLYETYTELWAETLNIMFTVFLSDPPKKKGRLPLVKWISMMEKMMETEMEFTIFQAKKVLDHQKLKYTDLFIPEKAVYYHEDTQAFSYYILKSVWMIHLNAFLEFCAKQPGGSSLKFQLSPRNLEVFIEKMKMLAKSAILLEKYTQSTLELHKESVFANTTLRMTLYELE
jgi:hypothetical protein